MPKINFPFVKKEGKFFAPIVQEKADYQVVEGEVVPNGTKIEAGIKGVYAKVRLSTTSPEQRELFALNSEAVNSSD